jgi:hypothetical protein
VERNTATAKVDCRESDYQKLTSTVTKLAIE